MGVDPQNKAEGVPLLPSVPPFSSPPLRSRPLKSSWEIWESAVSSSSRA